MPSWNQLLEAFAALPDDAARNAFLQTERDAYFQQIASLRKSNVIFYGSAFLQKQQVPAQLTSINPEDLNGFMPVLYGMDYSKPLTLILHTPGGSPNAAQSIVEYLREKFPAGLEVIVPTFAMSAGTMISLGSDRIIMGRQSQLGPIDPQFTISGRQMSARGIVDQFKRATEEILKNPGAAHVWAPVTQSLGPALLSDAQSALDYSEMIVAEWLSHYMFASEGSRKAKAHGKRVAKHFNDASTHKSHGRRIAYEEVKAQGVTVERLEDSQQLQEAVLSLYHLVTILFEQSPAAKVIIGHSGQGWVKNLPTGP